MSFTLTSEVLERICAINSFPRQKGWTFFGIRGARPVDPVSHPFSRRHELEIAPVTYINPCCTIGQWDVQAGELAVFPGSTVPEKSYVKEAQADGGVGTNQLLTGRYSFIKGVHLRGKPKSSHHAFKQNGDRAYRRSSDDLDYDGDDRVEWGNPGDNLHAAWCGSISGQHSSRGCQVVVGYPETHGGNSKESGPWKQFRNNAYALDQNVFDYLLLDAWEVQRTASTNTPQPNLLRFGSEGSEVGEIQRRLSALGFYKGVIDEDFGVETSQAVHRFQVKIFGRSEADGVIGPSTAAALDIDVWPEAQKTLRILSKSRKIRRSLRHAGERPYFLSRAHHCSGGPRARDFCLK